MESSSSDVLGTLLEGLDTYTFNGERYWLGCEVIGLLGLSNTTQAIKGTKDKPKLRYPAYRKEFIPEVNKEQSVYLLSLEGIIQVIKMNRTKRTKSWQEKLEETGL